MDNNIYLNLYNKYCDGDMNAKEELIELLAPKVAKTVERHSSLEHNTDELMNVGMKALDLALKSYSDKYNFLSYISTYINNYIVRRASKKDSPLEEAIIFNDVTLPSILDSKEVDKYIAKSKLNDNEALNKLLNHNLKRVVVISQKYESDFMSFNELVTAGTIGLIKAINKYDPENNYYFSTLADNLIEREIVANINECKKRKDMFLERIVPFDERLQLCYGDPTNSYIDKESLEEIYSYIDKLPDKKKDIYSKYYSIGNDESYTTEKIAQLYNVTRQNISSTIKKINDSIRGMIELDNMEISEELQGIIQNTFKNFRICVRNAFCSYYGLFNHKCRDIHEIEKKYYINADNVSRVIKELDYYIKRDLKDEPNSDELLEEYEFLKNKRKYARVFKK